MTEQFFIFWNLLRVRQWVKNILCLAGAFFTPGIFFSSIHFVNAFMTMIAFCFASSSVYVLNDVFDVEKDRLHPKKKNRPIACGKISIITASFVGICLASLSMALAWLCGMAVISCIFTYFICNLFYSAGLKNKPVIDVFCISFGFILRLLAGVYAVGDKVSAWMLLCTLFITLFFGFSKRRSELASAGTNARPSLVGYSIEYLDFLIVSTGMMAILTYAIFTVSGGRDSSLVLTVLPVTYAVFHLVRLVQVKGGVEAAEEIILQDRNVLYSGLIWFISFVIISHWSPQWFL